jgi:hypothetical protein
MGQPISGVEAEGGLELLNKLAAFTHRYGWAVILDSGGCLLERGNQPFRHHVEVGRQTLEFRVGDEPVESGDVQPVVEQGKFERLQAHALQEELLDGAFHVLQGKRRLPLRVIGRGTASLYAFVQFSHEAIEVFGHAFVFLS